jgi:HlyD family secretion protein
MKPRSNSRVGGNGDCSLKKFIFIGILLLAAAGAAWIYRWKSAPPEVMVTAARVETLVDTLSTNGKTEPAEYRIVLAGREGTLTKLLVEKGRQVAAGAVIAQIESRDSRSSLDQAEARVAQVKAEMTVFDQGGRAGEIAEINGAEARLKLQLKAAERELEASQRLAEKKYATAQEVSQSQDQVDQFRAQIRALDAKRAVLVMPADKAAAQARLREAEAAVEIARRRLESGVVRAPISGTVYQVEPKPGAYLEPGSELVRIGRVDKLRVTVYVDEPELGRVAVGMPVTITWDALAGKEWKGTVDKIPTEIVAFGTRQVGEVICIIDNPGKELYPGANVNAAIRSRGVENALTLPKETLRRENGVDGVYVVANGVLKWQPVKTGVSNVTRIQVLDGLKAGDAVLLPLERPIKDGMVVKAVAQ